LPPLVVRGLYAAVEGAVAGLGFCYVHSEICAIRCFWFFVVKKQWITVGF
jgi:hypothetical protein